MIRAAFLALALAPAAAGAADRVAVAGGDLAEIVFALGAGESVVGVDSTATYPEAARALPQLGYVRRISAEGALSLSPDLLIAAHDAAPEIALEQIAAAGVRVARAPEASGVAGIGEKIRFVGAELGRAAEAERLAAEVSARLAEVEAKVARIEGRPRALFVLAIQNGLPLVGGDATEADEIIRLAGGVNAAAGVEGYRPMSREALIAAAPEIVLLMETRSHAEGGIEAALARPDFAATPAGRAGRGATVDGALLLGFGPRTPEAVETLARLIHGPAASAAGL